jgi:hypothetical protein
MTEELVQQEFFCSFTAGAAGAYYGKEMEEARKAGRITEVPYDPNHSVELWLDLGYNDATSVWVMQPRGLKLCAIRYAEFKTMGIPRIVPEIKKWGYRIDLLRLPHDGDVHDQTTGRTRREVWEDELGCTSDDSPRPKNNDERIEQIAATRNLIPSIWFDAKECEEGIFALESYARDFDEKTKRYKDTPKHDWASHGADALRTGAVRHVPGQFGKAEPNRASMRSKPRVIRAGVRRRREPMDWSKI